MIKTTELKQKIKLIKDIIEQNIRHAQTNIDFYRDKNIEDGFYWLGRKRSYEEILDLFGLIGDI